MSIQSEINRINSNVQSALNAVADTGVSVPEGANSDNLPAAVSALANEKQDKLTGAQGQIVGFGPDGKAVAQDKPTYAASEVGAIPTTEKGAASGVATLGADRKIPAEQLPTMDYATKTDLSAHTDDADIHVTASEKAAWDAKADAPFKPAGKSYLTFSSPNSFTLAVGDATKHWDGTLEYFASDKTWTTWDGTTTLSAVDNDGEYVLYLRGTGNTVINGNATRPIQKWTLTGSDIKCTGNIEYLLDYATVQSGAHPTMAGYCYKSLFYGCTALTQAPSLPATTLADYCYHSMFSGCTALTQAPTLPATALAIRCYRSMFNGCTSLTKAPILPATTLASNCYENMFKGCTSLIQAPALPATTLADRCYNSMFSGCTNLKLSTTKTGEYTQEYRIPSSGTGTTATDALTNMFTSTGGTFTGTPEINTTYYLSSDNMVVRETEIATLNGYVGSMIDCVTTESIGAAPASHAEDTAIHLPTVTADDNGKLLCVVNGAWAAVSYPNAEGSTF